MRPSLKSLIAGGNSVVVPGIADALTAIMVEKAGFCCVYASGAQISAMMGYPDVGLITMTEMLNQISRICGAVGVPVFADADTGYGNAVNVIRTVKEYERMGVSAIHLEDQVLPKKCSRYAGKEMIPPAEMCMKIKAALDARTSDDFMVVARTEAASASSFDDAVDRANQYRRAGADAIMYQSPASVEDLRTFRARVDGPLVITLGSWDLDIGVEGVKEIGYEVILVPNATMRASIKAITECLHTIKTSGDINSLRPMIAPLSTRDDLLSVDAFAALEERYSPKQ